MLYNSAPVVEACLASLPSSVEVIIVDNASTDDGGALAAKQRPDSLLISSPRNIGFGAGCNRGWEAASRPIVAFLNPDLRLQTDTLDRLLRTLCQHDHAIVGPALLDASGRPRRAKIRPSWFLDFCGLLPAAARWAPSGWDGRLSPGAPVHSIGGEVHALDGACLLMRQTDLEAVGGFDEDFFLYYEEESLAHRLQRMGGVCIYDQTAIASHEGGRSTEFLKPFAVRQFHRSRIIYYRKRNGNFRGRLIGLVLLMAAIASLCAAALNAFATRKPWSAVLERLQIIVGIVSGIITSLKIKMRY